MVATGNIVELAELAETVGVGVGAVAHSGAAAEVVISSITAKVLRTDTRTGLELESSPCSTSAAAAAAAATLFTPTGLDASSTPPGV